MALSKNAMIAIAVAAILVVAGICAAVLLNGNNNSKDPVKPDNPDYQSVTISTFTDYNGNKTDITFDKMPERVVCGCNTALNLLLYLGLGDKIVGSFTISFPSFSSGLRDFTASSISPSVLTRASFAASYEEFVSSITFSTASSVICMIFPPFDNSYLQTTNPFKLRRQFP